MDLTLLIYISTVGLTVGAIVGAIISMKSGNGFILWTRIGAVTGYTLSAEIFKLIFALWAFDDPHLYDIDCTLLIGTVSKLVNEIAIGERLNPSIEASSQEDAIQAQDNEVLRIHSDGSTRSSIIELQKRTLNERNMADILWNGPSCSICLQDFQREEKVCILPQCRHTFHVPCVSKWLTGHSTCPLCRGNIQRMNRKKRKSHYVIVAT